MSQTVRASGPGVAMTKYLGANLANNINYYANEFPFTNLFKQATPTSCQAWIAWADTFATNNTGNPDALSAWGNLNVDSDGYVKTLTGKNGTIYAGVGTSTLQNCAGPAVGGVGPGIKNMISRYPVGPYTWKYIGEGTVRMDGDVASITSCTSDGAVKSTVSGNTITSYANGGTTTVVFTSSMGGGGFRPRIIALPNIANYLRGMSLVAAADVADFNAGKMFASTFKATLANYSRLRTMKWFYIEGIPKFTITATAGASAGTLGTPWFYPTGTYAFTFNTGEQRFVNCVWNSTAVSGFSLTFAGAAATLTQTASNGWFATTLWANGRQVASSFSYGGTKGPPVEIVMQLCNELNIDVWLNLPCSVDMDQAQIDGTAAMCFNGAGSTIPAMTGVIQKVWIEYVNEIWNGAYADVCGGWVQSAGNFNFPSAGDKKKVTQAGKMTAAIGDSFYAAYGSPAEATFRNRVMVMMGGQTVGGAGYYTNESMLTNFWTSRAWQHHIGGFAVAPYMGWGVTIPRDLIYFSTTAGLAGDVGVIPPLNGAGVKMIWTAYPTGNYLAVFNTGESRTLVVDNAANTVTWTPALTIQPTDYIAYIRDAGQLLAEVNPLDAVFALAFTNVYKGKTYTYIPAAGWVYVQDANVRGLISELTSGQPWGLLPFSAYEAGHDFAPGTDGLYSNLFMSVTRDPRFELLFNDPQNKMWTTYAYPGSQGRLGYYPTMLAAGITAGLNDFCHILSPSKYAQDGALESALQVFQPLASAPPKYQGIMKYIAGT